MNTTKDQTLSVEHAFAEFVMRQAQFAFRVAFAALRNASDAEDVVQETFLKLYRSGRWQGAKDERAYLARSVWRMASASRTRSRRSPVEQAETREPASMALDPEQHLLRAHAHSAVHRLIDSLPEKLRVPLVLSSFEELHSGEIAAILDLPEGTVRRRTMQARTLLKQKFATMERLHAR